MRLLCFRSARIYANDDFAINIRECFLFNNYFFNNRHYINNRSSIRTIIIDNDPNFSISPKGAALLVFLSIMDLLKQFFMSGKRP